MSTPRDLAPISVSFGGVKTVVPSPDAKSVLMLSDIGQLNELEIGTYETLTENNIPTMTDGNINAISSYMPFKSFLFAGEEGGIFEAIWPECTTKKLIDTKKGEQILLDVSSHQHYVAQSQEEESQEYTVKIYADPEWNEQQYRSSSAQVKWLKFSPSEQFLAFYDDSGRINVFESRTLEEVYDQQIDCDPHAITWDSNSNIIYPDKSNKIVCFNLQSGTELKADIDAQSSSIIAIAIMGDSLATLSVQRRIVISTIEETDNQFILETKYSHDCTLEELSDEVEVTFFDFVDKKLIIGDSIGSIRVLDVGKMQEKETEKTGQTNTGDNEEAELSDVEESQRISTPSRLVPVSETGIIQTPRAKKKKDKKNKIVPFDEIPRPTRRQREEDLDEDVVDFSKLDEMEEEEESSDEIPMPKGSRIKANSFYSRSAMEAPAGEYSESFSDEEVKPKAKKIRKPLPELTEEQKAKNFEEKFGASSESEESSSESSDEELEGKTEKEKEQIRIRRQKKLEKEAREMEKEAAQILAPEDRSDGEEEVSEEVSSVSEYSSDDEDAPFMPGSTFDYSGNRRFLCWNAVGAVFIRDTSENNETGDDFSMIDIEFADTFSNRDRITKNVENIVLATLNDKGFLGASSNLLIFRMHRPWSADGETKVRFRRSNAIDLIAIGDEWMAAITARGHLHILTYSGVQIAVFGVPGRAQTMVGGKERLFIVYNKSTFMLLDVVHHRRLANGNLPGRVTWTCFDDDDNIFILTDNKIVYELVFDFGFHWIPMLDVRRAIALASLPKPQQARSALSSDDEFNALESDTESQEGEKYSDFWCVSVSSGKIYGAFLKEDESIPKSSPTPGLTGLDLKVFTAEDDDDMWLEARVALLNSKKEKRMDRMIAHDQILIGRFTNAIGTERAMTATQVGMQIKSDQARVYATQIAKAKNRDDIAGALEGFYDANPITEEEEDVIEPARAEDSDGEIAAPVEKHEPDVGEADDEDGAVESEQENVPETRGEENESDNEGKVEEPLAAVTDSEAPAESEGTDIEEEEDVEDDEDDSVIDEDSIAEE